MRKVVFAIALIFVLSLIGCSDEAPATTTTSTTEITLPTTTTTSTTTPLISAEITALQEKASKISSVKYSDSATKDEISLMGAKAKRKLFEKRGLNIGMPYEFVYLDLNDKTAYAVCDSSLCKPEHRRKYWQVDYDLFAVSNDPITMIKSVSSGTLDTIQTKILSNFPVTYMDFQDNQGRKGVMWVNMFYGVPLEYTINNQKTAYNFIVFKRRTYRICSG